MFEGLTIGGMVANRLFVAGRGFFCKLKKVVRVPYPRKRACSKLKYLNLHIKSHNLSPGVSIRRPSDQAVGTFHDLHCRCEDELCKPKNILCLCELSQALTTYVEGNLRHNSSLLESLKFMQLLSKKLGSV